MPTSGWISVTGFRGVGPELTVPLQPRPGLVVIAGRNGSGKSTIAEALEMALTGESYRWRNRSVVWTGNWRNLHSTGAASIRVDIAEEGSGVTTIGIDWTAGASLRRVQHLGPAGREEARTGLREPRLGGAHRAVPATVVLRRAGRRPRRQAERALRQTLCVARAGTDHRCPQPVGRAR